MTTILTPDKLKSVTIILADDHDVVRKGLRTMLETQENWRVCGEATTGYQAVTLAAECQPRIAVLDLEMVGLDGLQATRRIRKDSPATDILIFTMHDADYLIREALVAGARGFVLKSEGGRKLIEAIHAVLNQEPFFAARASESLLNRFLKSPADVADMSPLTGREREIVQLLANGRSNKEAADALRISAKTVETHRATIMRKLRCGSITELVRYAVREHIIKA